MFKTRLAPFAMTLIVWQFMLGDIISFDTAVVFMFLIAMVASVFYTPINYTQYNIYHVEEEQEESQGEES